MQIPKFGDSLDTSDRPRTSRNWQPEWWCRERLDLTDLSADCPYVGGYLTRQLLEVATRFRCSRVPRIAELERINMVATGLRIDHQHPSGRIAFLLSGEKGSGQLVLACPPTWVVGRKIS
ncbi:hypothetical protein [Fodinicola feengrottensis]|uniref:hypothetical protein n=1 Tax=Fodinicola feengrottensis TaxID=435914 RepID=UPI0024418E1C|nr:hypothetical protein [Fodinicola feengrottensis]